MAGFFFDSSGLTKRYAREIGSTWVESTTDLDSGNVLDFVDFVARKRLKATTQTKAVEKRPPFRTARGIMKRDMENLESDLSEARQEMWQVL